MEPLPFVRRDSVSDNRSYDTCMRERWCTQESGGLGHPRSIVSAEFSLAQLSQGFACPPPHSQCPERMILHVQLSFCWTENGWRRRLVASRPEACQPNVKVMPLLGRCQLHNAFNRTYDSCSPSLGRPAGRHVFEGD